MITIDNKIELFSKIVLDKVRNEYNDAMKNIEQRHQENKESQLKELEKQSIKYTREMEQRAFSEQKKIISKAKGQARKNILVKKEELFLELKALIIEEVKKYCSSKEYVNFISSKIKDNIDEILSLDEKCLVMSRSVDQKIIEEQLKNNGFKSVLKFVVDDDILGGFIIIDQIKGIKMNFTVDSIIEENHIYIGTLIHDLLKEAGEAIE